MKLFRITYLSIAVLLLTQLVQAADRPYKSPAREFVTNFELNNNLIIIKVRMNGADEDFILDSGAPGIILNEQYYAGRLAKTSAEGIAGSYKLGKFKISSLNWADTVITDQEVPTLDLSNLCRVTGRKIKGLIGYTMLSNCEMLIDYEKKKLTISRAEKLELHNSVQPVDSVAFIYSKHIPVLRATINDAVFNLGLDCGAGSNLLALNEMSKLPETSYKSIEGTKLEGADRNSKQAKSLIIDKVNLSSTSDEHMLFVASDISNLNNGNGVKIDGLLGFPYLSYHKTSIDFAHQKLYIWP